MQHIRLYILTGACLISIVLKLQHGRYFIGLILFLAYFVTTKHNLTFHPHYQVWMCNLTALFSLILVFKFSQNLFDITFFFAWTGDVFTFFTPNNQTLPDIYDFPLVWVIDGTMKYVESPEPKFFEIY